MVADHFEPLLGGTNVPQAVARVERWRKTLPEIALRHADSAGRPPQYTFFYPQEEYRPELLDPLTEMTRMGIGDVEVHIHHDGEGERNFIDRMEGFCDALHNRHGLLRRIDGRITFGFVHGNWALDNSLPGGKLCGLNNEITLLKNMGCYADFTLPAAPTAAQTRIVNSIYWATDDPLRPKSHDTGELLVAGQPSSGDLLMIQGPIGLRFGENGRFAPRIEMGELAGYDLPSRARARVWLDLSPRLGDNIFIKLHTHGTQDRNMGPLLDGGLETLFAAVEAECVEAGMTLHYATARELYEAVIAAHGVSPQLT